MIFKNRDKIREYWKKLMHSTHKKLSEGASNIARCMPWSRKENWRRNDKVQHGHEHHQGKKK